MMRLFIAIPLPPEVEAELGRVDALLKQQGGKVKWVDPKNIHLTVRFLGETEESKVDRIKQVINDASVPFSHVTTVIDRLGAFPNLSRPRVIWAGLTDDERIEPLSKLARQIELAVRKLRFEKEKKGFRPHLTLGRVRDSRTTTELAAFIKSYEFAPVTLNLDRICLFKSTLTPKGPIYERLHEVLLSEERLGG